MPTTTARPSKSSGASVARGTGGRVSYNHVAGWSRPGAWQARPIGVDPFGLLAEFAHRPLDLNTVVVRL